MINPKHGDKIRSRRIALGINQTELCDRVRICNTHLRNVEKGRWPVGNLRFATVVALARALDLNLEKDFVPMVERES